jgi:hypothetical protein
MWYWQRTSSDEKLASASVLLTAFASDAKTKNKPKYGPEQPSTPMYGVR